MSRAYMPPAKSQEWGTPDWLFDALHREFRFTVDGAASDKLHKLDRYWTKEIDGLAQDWCHERVFLNPPFLANDLDAWAFKAAKESRDDMCLVAMVCPVKSEQDWWHRWVIPYAYLIRFIKGRVRFTGGQHTAPGPTCVVVWFGRQLRSGPIISTMKGERDNGLD